jgi:hypothetical protein
MSTIMVTNGSVEPGVCEMLDLKFRERHESAVRSACEVCLRHVVCFVFPDRRNTGDPAGGDLDLELPGLI